MSGRPCRAASKRSAERLAILIAENDRDDEDNDELSDSHLLLPQIPSTSDPLQARRMEFENDMNLNVLGVINEAIHLFGMDPREYHPFYLRVYKHITIGEKMGLITSKRDGDFYWEKYDNLCAAKMSELGRSFEWIGDKSAYALFIETGNVIVNGKQVSVIRSEKEIEKIVGALELRAKSIVEVELKRRRVATIDILNDLKMRLAFFEICKVMTFPADCVRMNKLWHNFINNFNSSPSRVKVERYEEVKIEDGIEDEFQEPIQVSFPPPESIPTTSGIQIEMKWEPTVLSPKDVIRERRKANKLFKKVIGSRVQKGLEKRKKAKKALKSALYKNSFKKIEDKKKLELENLICLGLPSKHKRKTVIKSRDSPLKAFNASDLTIRPNPNRFKPIESSGKGPFICEECGKQFPKARAVRRHKLTQHDPEPHSNKCPICLQELSNPLELGLHFLRKHTLECGHDGLQPIHSPAEVYPKPCKYCLVQVGSYDEFRNHVRRVHAQDMIFPCPHCPKQYKTKDWLEAHIREIHLGITYHCDICSRNLQSGGKLWKHKVETHGLTDLPPPAGVQVEVCDICGEKLMRGMLQHIKKHHPEKAESYEELHKQMRKEKKKMYKKIEMERERQGRLIRKNQLEKEEEIDVKMGLDLLALRNDKYACHKVGCKLTFPKRYRWERHIQSHLQQLIRLMERVGLLEQVGGDALLPQWKCAICEEELRGNEAMGIHLVCKHRQTLDKLPEEDVVKITLVGRLQCPQCNNQSNSYQELRTHLEIEHPLTCWRCPECEVVMITPDDLQEHFLLEHSEANYLALWGKVKEEDLEKEKTPKKKKKKKQKVVIADVPNPMSCLHCPEQFKDRNELAAHMKVDHPWEQVFECGHCHSLRFTERALLFHLVSSKCQSGRVSTWQNPFLTLPLIPCEICDEGVRADAYLQHVKRRHGIVETGEGWRCPCGRNFTQRSPWIIHMEEIHKGNIDSLLALARQINRKEEIKAQIKVPKVIQKNMQCLYCPEKCVTRAELANHVKEAHPSETIWECPYCSRSNKRPRFTERALHYHVTCGACSKKALKNKSRKWINPCEDPLMELPCKICEEKVKLHNYLGHLKTKHKLTIEGPLKCPCNLSFDKLEFWLIHSEEIHAGNVSNLVEIVRNMSLVEVEKKNGSLREEKVLKRKRRKRKASSENGAGSRPTKRGRSGKGKRTKEYEDYKAEFNLKDCWVHVDRLRNI